MIDCYSFIEEKESFSYIIKINPARYIIDRKNIQYLIHIQKTRKLFHKKEQFSELKYKGIAFSFSIRDSG